jgi:Periplasmic binding protein
LEYTAVDSAGDANQGLLAAKQLLGTKHIDMLMLSTQTVVDGGIFPVATQSKTISFSGCSGAACGDGKQFPYQFQTGAPASQQAAGTVAGIRQVMNGSQIKIGQLSTPDAQGQQFAAGVANLVKPFSDMHIVSSQTFLNTTSDLTVQLSKLQSAGANVISVGGNAGPQTLPTIINGITGLNYDVTVVGALPLLNARLDQLAGPPSVLSKIYVESLGLGVRTGSGAPTNQVVKEVSAVDPHPSAGWAVVVDTLDAVSWYQWAVSRTGGTDPDKIAHLLGSVGTLSSDQLPKSLAGIQDPRWSTTDHSSVSADFTHYWGMVQPSPVIDGTYKGILITLQKA